MIGVAASSAPKSNVLIAGVAMSMAVGEYVSVSSQRDAEQADIEREKMELATQPQAEAREFAAIYVKRGLDERLARQVAEQLASWDRLGAHLRDELGIDPQSRDERRRAGERRDQALLARGERERAHARLHDREWGAPLHGDRELFAKEGPPPVSLS
jgi:VIT1/CCC1 family predicted Fe2+/Mn2+ transporter